MTSRRTATADLLEAYPPRVLREYALIADGERGILVGPRGEFAWMCAPRWHDEAIFASLIGGSGCYAVTPVGASYVWGGAYEEGSLIWRSRWVTTESIIECREALAFPGDPHRAVVLRRISSVSGRARVRVALDARAGFGGHRMVERSLADDGTWTMRSGPLRLRWTGASTATPQDPALEVGIELNQGDHQDLVLEISDQALPHECPPPDALWAGTERAWRDAVPPMVDTIAERDARHSYAVMRGLTSEAGGMVAAATMSLPERAEQGRNYDYRYAWIRDQCFAGEAVAANGPHPLLDNAVRFVSERLQDAGPQLKPAYTVSGEPVPDETSLALPGYPGGTDKVGNWVNKQFQLDAFGEALLLFAAAAQHDRLDVSHWSAVQLAAEAIEQRWGEADAGIWELRNHHWAHSRLICAAGLRAMGRAVATAQTAEWSGLADAIVADVGRDCLHPSGRWQRAPDDDGVDASLLLASIRGAVPASDPRSIATFEAVRADLGRDGYVYRFRQDQRPLHDAEGAFLLCGFQLALASHQQGHESDALRWFERNRAASGPPGLFTEEFDVIQRQLRGNLPQAFVHALLLETASRLSRPWAQQSPEHITMP